jgi:CDP-glycerol glycerophosphotransferase (TagB/SpsB family)
MQFPRESRITLRGKPYLNQKWIIEYIYRSIPDDYELVVKPHPHRPYILPNRHVLSISRFANFAHPEYNTYNLIKNSDTVITVNNTVGYESLLHGKSVVVLGNAFYSGCGYTYDVDNIKKLSNIIQEAIDSSGLNDDEIIEVASRTLQASSPGIWPDSSDENVSKFYNSLVEHLEVV